MNAPLETSEVTPPQLVMAVAENARHIDPELQRELAYALRLWSHPVIMSASSEETTMSAANIKSSEL